MTRHHSHGRARSRRVVGGRWRVHARVERYTEPGILLLLRERPAHGYELLERLGELTGEAVEMGNLYRLLRGLEEEGFLESTWTGDAPGPAKRTYSITDPGRRLLDEWADALRRSQERIAGFLARYERR